mmetsp:Transcript_22027/g.66070  ORF Transcript_22027/g.66070 Transcript_22027/m.66070 type:complete len:263 (-) Transcript_22027:82-870(-)
MSRAIIATALAAAAVGLAEGTPNLASTCYIPSGLQRMAATAVSSADCTASGIPSSYTPGQTYTITVTSAASLRIMVGSSGASGSTQWSGPSAASTACLKAGQSGFYNNAVGTSLSATWTAPVGQGNIDIGWTCGNYNTLRVGIQTVTTASGSAPTAPTVAPTAAPSAAPSGGVAGAVGDSEDSEDSEDNSMAASTSAAVGILVTIVLAYAAFLAVTAARRKMAPVSPTTAGSLSTNAIENQETFVGEGDEMTLVNDAGIAEL